MKGLTMNTIEELSNKLLDNIKEKLNECLMSQQPEDEDPLELISCPNLDTVIGELSQNIQEEYSAIKNQKIDECLWDGNDYADKNALPKAQKYYDFHKKLRNELWNYFVNENDVDTSNSNVSVDEL